MPQLGGPLRNQGVADALTKHQESLARFNSKLMFLLRSAPCFDRAELPEFEKSFVDHSTKRQTVI